VRGRDRKREREREEKDTSVAVCMHVLIGGKRREEKSVERWQAKIVDSG